VVSGERAVAQGSFGGVPSSAGRYLGRWCTQLRNLVDYTTTLIGPDPGIGPAPRKQALIRALRSPIRLDGAEYNQIKILLQAIEAEYLQNWATALRANTQPRAERSARYIASFLLDAGFSAPYLHRWMTYRVEHEPGTRTLANILDDAVALVSTPNRTYRVLVAFEAAAEAKSGPPANWIEPAAVTAWLQANNHSVVGIRQNGGMWFSVEAPDSWSAVGKVVEIVDRLTSRVILGTNGRLIPLPSAWVEGQPKRYRFGILPRQVQVHALHREDKLYTVTKGNIVDAALELLAPLENGSPCPAISTAFAGDGLRVVIAGDGAAAIYALLGSARLNGVNPERWLDEALSRMHRPSTVQPDRVRLSDRNSTAADPPP
jgi:hypothetical protein